jgi:D-3-phosphoglycerate dehydrogenase
LAKVLIVQPIAPEGIQLLEDQGFEVKQLSQHDPDTLKREVADADALLVRDARIPREVIEAGHKLKVISRHGAGLEKIDVPAATGCGIYVTSTPIANSVSVAEHVLGMMLILTKNILKVDHFLREGDFEVRHRIYGAELEGKTLGIIGLGNVGQRLAKKAIHGMEMSVIGFDPFVKAEILDPAILLSSKWDRIFQESDFVSLHLPLNEKTRGLIGKREFHWMKKTAFFINCARGKIIVEEALIQALRERVIAGAGVDVYSITPPPKDNPLWTMENTVVTPHYAAHTREAMVKMATQAAQGIIEVLNGTRPTWAVNQIR